MIEKFSYRNKNGGGFPVNLGGRYIYFDEDYENKFNLFFDGSQKGIFWLSKNQKIEIWSNKGDVTGLPSIDMQYVIAIYSGDQAEYRLPNNVVIYNADGSVHKVLSVPLLISDAAKNQGWYKRQPDETIGFTGINWKENDKGEKVVVMEISDHYYRIMKEYRVLNPETGNFGECVDSRIEYK